VAEPTVATAPSVAEARAWRGFPVDDVSGAQVGRAHGLFVDADGGEPAWLVVALRRRFRLFGRRVTALVVLPVRDCAGAGGRVWSGHAGEAIRTAPTVDPTRPLLREHELAICAHYGVGERLGRAAEVLGRPEGVVSAIP
jgi:hypothetical protein